MRSFLLKHVDVFGPLVTQWQELFRRCYALVCTTAFADEIERTILAPFAHCLNHQHQMDTIFFTLNRDLHIDPLRIKSYFDGAKFLTDARILYLNDREGVLKE